MRWDGVARSIRPGWGGKNCRAAGDACLAGADSASWRAKEILSPQLVVDQSQVARPSHPRAEAYGADTLLQGQNEK